MGDKTLKKENQKLRNEVQTLMAELQSLKSEFEKIQDGSRSRSPTIDLTQVESSVQFTSDKYDDLLKFVKDAQGQLKSLSSKIAVISQRSDEIAAAIDEMLQYSYQYNVKILGMPMASERETPSETASLCLKLFSALGEQTISTCMRSILHIEYREDNQQTSPIPLYANLPGV